MTSFVKSAKVLTQAVPVIPMMHELLHHTTSEVDEDIEAIWGLTGTAGSVEITTDVLGGCWF